METAPPPPRADLMRVWSLAHPPVEVEDPAGPSHMNLLHEHEGVSLQVAEWEERVRAAQWIPKIHTERTHYALFIIAQALPTNPLLEQKVNSILTRLQDIEGALGAMEANVEKVVSAVNRMMGGIVTP
jgi:hypothetical protein